LRRWLPIGLALFLAAAPAAAQLPVGATVPAFSKSLLGGGTVTNTSYPGKVVVLFLLGYS
jgi:hypothetical protein